MMRDHTMVDTIRDLEAENADGQRELTELQAEVAGLKLLADFGTAVLDYTKEAVVEGGYEIEVEQLAEMAVDAGLMVYEPYDPKNHPHMNFDVDPGDKIFYWGKEGDDG